MISTKPILIVVAVLALSLFGFSMLKSRTGRYAVATMSVTATPIASPFAYPAGLTGYAISWAQCNRAYPETPYDFGIIDVTGGRSLSHNPCLQSEFVWASRAPYPPTFYINLTYPTPEHRRGILTSRQYGYETARDAYEYANSQGASSPMWWLDVQTKSAWSQDKNINANVVLGAIDFFNEKKLSIGLSTTPYQWSKVVGSLVTDLPNWIPGIPGKARALQYCRNGTSYSGGYVQQLADITPQFETVYTCGARRGAY